jgi:molecular chaperone GrpE
MTMSDAKRADETAPTDAGAAPDPTDEAAPAAAEPAAGGPGDGQTDDRWRDAVAQVEDRWRRAVAELDNTRKRFERQLTEQTRAERARTAAAFLPVLDNLDLALRHADADPTAIVTGVQAVRQQAVDILVGLGYQQIDPAGERFDPARHEAARVVPAGEGVEPGTVVDVLRPGYVDSTGALVRAAVVTVARARPADDRPADEGVQT